LDEAVIGYLLGFPEVSRIRTMSRAPRSMPPKTRQAGRVAATGVACRACRDRRCATTLSASRLSGLLELFNDHWQLLPSAEAASTVEELVNVVTAAPDQRGS
jgi:hypothetical protein